MPNSVYSHQCSILANILKISNSIVEKWYLTVVLFCDFLIMSGFDHFLICLIAIYFFPFSVNSLFLSFPQVTIGLFIFLLFIYRSSLYVKENSSLSCVLYISIFLTMYFSFDFLTVFSCHVEFFKYLGG